MPEITFVHTMTICPDVLAAKLLNEEEALFDLLAELAEAKDVERLVNIGYSGSLHQEQAIEWLRKLADAMEKDR